MSHSKRWLREHFADEYVKKAQASGYPSRAAYKLLEIQEKDKIFRSGMIVVDLGAAPGGWSVVAHEILGRKGRVFALDRLPMDPITGVEFILGDFTEQAVLDQLLSQIDDQKVDVVMSDMAPNMSGMKSVDQPASMYLVDLAWDCARKILKPDGTFLTKLFMGEGAETFIKELRQHFKSVKTRKPDASRSRSPEVYLLAKGFQA